MILKKKLFRVFYLLIGYFNRVSNMTRRYMSRFITKEAILFSVTNCFCINSEVISDL